MYRLTDFACWVKSRGSQVREADSPGIDGVDYSRRGRMPALLLLKSKKSFLKQVRYFPGEFAESRDQYLSSR